MKLVIGTRGSKLSIIQTMEVVEALRRLYPEIEPEIRVIKTRGDIDLETPLYMIPQKGIFEKEIDLALVRGEVDAAVHSLKDYPTETFEQVRIAAVPKRLSPFDAFVSDKYPDLSVMPTGSTVGTSSLRREAFVKYLRRDLEVVHIRGNVDTRLRKMSEGQVDALILAEAGLERLGERRTYSRLSMEDFPPPAGQGALAVVVRSDNHRLLDILSSINDDETMLETTVERRIISLLNAGCKTPLGVYAESEDGGMRVLVSTVSVDYERKVTVDEFFEGDDVEKISLKAVEVFRERGGHEVIKGWRARLG